MFDSCFDMFYDIINCLNLKSSSPKLIHRNNMTSNGHNTKQMNKRNKIKRGEGVWELKERNILIIGCFPRIEYGTHMNLFN